MNLPPIREAEFMDQVIALARLRGWKVAHFRPARTEHGWRTPVAADGKGWPDLVLVHPRQKRALFVELKAQGGKLTVEQDDWLRWLAEAGLSTAIWRPDMWSAIERELE